MDPRDEELTDEEMIELDREDELLDEIAEEFVDDPESAIYRAEQLGYSVDDIVDRL